MTRTTNPAAEFLTLAGTYLLALKMINTLAAPAGQSTLSPEQRLEEIREIASATLEHRKPSISEQTFASLANSRPQSSGTTHHQASSDLETSRDSLTDFLPEEIAWVCFLTTMEMTPLTVHTVRHASQETEALALALCLAANRRGELFSTRRAKRLLALVLAMEPEERNPYIEQARARLMGSPSSIGKETGEEDRTKP